MKQKTIAIIPARGGSKRIPRKNTRLFLGKPILQYSIEAAIESKLFDEVMVSTEDGEIAELAIKIGAKVPFLRSQKNADDYATTANVIEETIEEYQKRGLFFHTIGCIYPTAPFVSPSRLQEAMSVFQEKQADSIVPVTTYDFPIWRSLEMNENNTLSYIWEENHLKRSQDLPLAYHDCGLFYFLRTKSFLSEKKIIMPHSFPLMIPPTETQDIDDEQDWKLAELKYMNMKQSLI